MGGGGGIVLSFYPPYHHTTYNFPRVQNAQVRVIHLLLRVLSRAREKCSLTCETLTSVASFVTFLVRGAVWIPIPSPLDADCHLLTSGCRLSPPPPLDT